MLILQLSKFYPPVRGGIETATFQLTEGINRRGVRADVLCANDAAVTVRERAPGGYRITRAASLGRMLSVSVAPQLVAETARVAGHYDVIHVHMPDPLAALALWIARPKARVVVHWHSDVVRQSVTRGAYLPLQNWLLRRADAVIATTPVYAEASEALRGVADKLHVIPIGIGDPLPGVDIERVGSVRARYPGKRIVLGIGRMTYYKGFDVLIRAARMLPPNVQVLIGGDGVLFDEIRAQITRLGVGDRVQLLGPLTEEALLDHYAAADVFCLPSTARSEAFGIAMLEAMAMSKPVVSTDIQGSGVSWINQHGVTGLTVPVGQPGPLAAALNRLLDDRPMARAFGLAARLRYEQGFRVERMADNVIELYRGL